MALIEFKDLPDTSTPINAENLNKIQENNIYSTDEIEIGKWIDSKPIYRKVIVTTTSGQITHGISNYETIINMYGFVNISSGSGYGWQPVPRVQDLTTYGISIGNFRATDFTLTIGSSYGPLSKAIIIVEYTKTTD